MKMKKEKYIAPTTMIVMVEAGSIMAGSITGEEDKGFTWEYDDDKDGNGQ